jgi:beta-galactosidase GanA
MKYPEFQVYYHAFNSAFAAMCEHNNLWDVNTYLDMAISNSDKVANFVVEKFKTIEGRTPEEDNTNLASLVTETLNKAMKK